MVAAVPNIYLQEAQCLAGSIAQYQGSLIQAWIDWSGESKCQFYGGMGPTFLLFLPLEAARQVCLIVEPLLKGLGHLLSWVLSFALEEENPIDHLSYARYQLWDAAWGGIGAGVLFQAAIIEPEMVILPSFLIFVLSSMTAFDDTKMPNGLSLQEMFDV